MQVTGTTELHTYSGPFFEVSSANYYGWLPSMHVPSVKTLFFVTLCIRIIFRFVCMVLSPM